tara:strand:- start:279 stop:662 length:384 start_codon:yes stop_codon:yes gene_type:complete
MDQHDLHDYKNLILYATIAGRRGEEYGCISLDNDALNHEALEDFADDFCSALNGLEQRVYQAEVDERYENEIMIYDELSGEKDLFKFELYSEGIKIIPQLDSIGEDSVREIIIAYFDTIYGLKRVEN